MLIDCQPDAHLAAEEEARRLEGLRKQAAQERREQLERAHARGSQAMKKIHLTQVRPGISLWSVTAAARLVGGIVELLSE